MKNTEKKARKTPTRKKEQRGGTTQWTEMTSGRPKGQKALPTSAVGTMLEVPRGHEVGKKTRGGGGNKVREEQKKPVYGPRCRKNAPWLDKKPGEVERKGSGGIKHGRSKKGPSGSDLEKKKLSLAARDRRLGGSKGTGPEGKEPSSRNKT